MFFTVVLKVMCLVTVVPVEIRVKKKMKSFGSELACHTTTGAVLLPVLKQFCKFAWQDECHMTLSNTSLPLWSVVLQDY